MTVNQSFKDRIFFIKRRVIVNKSIIVIYNTHFGLFFNNVFEVHVNMVIKAVKKCTGCKFSVKNKVLNIKERRVDN